MPQPSSRQRPRWAVLAAVATLGLGASWSAAPRAAAAPAPASSAALGTHAMVYLDAPLSHKRAMFAASARLGASLVRVDVPLALVHHDPSGRPDYTAFDQGVTLARRAGVGLLGILATTPAWAAACPLGTPPAEVPTCPYADLRLYEQHVAGLVRRSRGTVEAWEVLNEPAGYHVFRAGPTEYALLLDAAIRAIHREDPSAKVLVGGVPYGPEGLAFITRALLTAGYELTRRIDATNLHVRGPVASLPGQVRSWKQLMLAIGVDKPLWVTEFGYASDARAQRQGTFGGPAEAARHGGGLHGQARYMEQALPALLRGGAAKVFVTLRGGPPGLWRSEGLLDGTGVADPPRAYPEVTPKPAWEAVRRLVSGGRLVRAILRGRELRRQRERAARASASGARRP